MNRRHAWAGMVLVIPLVLVGCGSASPTPGSAGTSGSEHTPGMVMPDGSTMTAAGTSTASESSETSDHSVDAAEPSPIATMVCEEEIQGDVKQLTGLTTTPKTTTTWKDGLFTCRYDLPTGTTVFSVKESTDATTARAYLDGLQAGASDPRSLEGLESLGLPSFASPVGTVAFVKDNLTLLVDATKMPALVGPANTARASYAYTLAANVLSCWKE